MGNNSIKVKSKELLSDNWYHLYKVTYDIRHSEGDWETQIREVYDRGNGATILLYNKARRTIILTRQFRLPSYLNGNDSGLLIEACAGLLEEDNAEECIKRETEEETGYKISKVEKIFESYMSPGSVTEIVHFFIAEYESDMKVSEGGGIEEEQENIEVLELDFDKAYNMIRGGGVKDAKTIMLLQYAKIHGLLDNPK
ncbi:MAG: GDP-mannose pyrophosphatase NudK [Saprospiraceae bacterium]|jgi:GDP-mannose pyrophosphatase NudK